MPIIIGENKPQVASAPYYQRKIKCPGHYLISPKVDIYLREPVPWANECSDYVTIKRTGQRIKIRKTRIARDRFGRKMVDWKKIYALQKTGEVIQPWITASFAIEHIYDPKSWLCFKCDKRCMRGKGIINEHSIGRLNGTPMKKR